MRFTCNFDMDNDAFTDDPQQEVARILRKIASQVKSSYFITLGVFDILDAKRNEIGNWCIDDGVSKNAYRD